MTREDLVARARSLSAVFRERSAKAESLRRMPDESIEAIVEAGLPRICQPARFGGFELGWDTVCEVAMELGRGCASQAWVSNVFTEHTCMLGLFPDEAQHEVWDENPRALVSTSYAPVGKVTPVAGGVRLSGHYTFSSGVHHAHWSIVGGMVPRDEGAPYPGLMLIRAADRRIVDNWHTMGMAGTGSADFVVEDVFVPQHRILDDTLVFAGRTPGSQVNAAPVYRMPQKGIAQTALASVPIGTALGAVADFAEAMRTGRSHGEALSGMQNLQLRLAESSVEAESAQRLVLGTVGDVMRKLEAGGRIDEADFATTMRNAAYGVLLARRSVTRLFEAAGGSGAFLSGSLQRSFRDVHAAGGHIGLAWDRNASLYGRWRAGLGLKGAFPGF